MNTVVLVGRLVRDPEAFGGGAGVNMRMAVDSRRKRGEEWVTEPNYFNIIVFGKQGETALEYLEKGREVGIEGRLQWRAWEKDGQKRETVEVVASHVQFIGPAPKKEEEDSPEAQTDPEPEPEEETPIEGGDEGEAPF